MANALKVRPSRVDFSKAGHDKALALAEHDLDPRRGSILVRHGKGGRRREVGMDEWGCEQVRRWLDPRENSRSGRCSIHVDGLVNVPQRQRDGRRHGASIGVGEVLIDVHAEW